MCSLGLFLVDLLLSVGLPSEWVPHVSDMRIFLFVLSIVSLLLATRQFSISEQTGQFKGALFLLLIGIQLLIAAALIPEHREERTRKLPMELDVRL